MNAVTVIQIKIDFNFMIIEGYVIDNSLIKALTQIEQWQNGNAVITIYQDRIDKCSFGKRIQLGKSSGTLSVLEITGQCRIPNVVLESIPKFQ